MYFMMYGVEKQLWCLYRHYLTAYATSNKLLSIQTAAVEKPSDELYPIKTHSRKSKLKKKIFQVQIFLSGTSLLQAHDTYSVCVNFPSSE